MIVPLYRTLMSKGHSQYSTSYSYSCTENAQTWQQLQLVRSCWRPRPRARRRRTTYRVCSCLLAGCQYREVFIGMRFAADVVGRDICGSSAPQGAGAVFAGVVNEAFEVEL